MSKYSNINELLKFKNELKAFKNREADIIKSIANELAARLLTKVKKRTPVGVYNDGRIGGTLRKNWSIGEITENNGVYQVDVTNIIDYASYVEYGHRTVDHKGWVEGRFMLTISSDELQKDSSRIIENKLKKILENKK